MRVLFLVQNTPYRDDNRVRREAEALCFRGAKVTVVCPAEAPEDRRVYEENGVRVYQYRVDASAPDLLGHLKEYVVSLFWQTLLAARVFCTRGFDVIHFANPPDLLWIVAWPYRLLGRRVIFDYHDQVPELFLIRFGPRHNALKWLVGWLERRSFSVAHHVITCNETCRRLAIVRGRMAAERVTVVRNAPRLSDFSRPVTDGSVPRPGRALVGYLGHVNPQDDLEVLIETARIIRDEYGRDNVDFLIIGSGTAWEEIRALRDRYELQQTIRMAGRLPRREMLAALGAVDLCVQPDLPNSFTDIATMNKLMEYMALSKPVVSFDLRETRVSGGDAVLYATEPTARSLAKEILRLVDDPDLRDRKGREGWQRVRSELAWEHQVVNLYRVYDRLCTEGRVRYGGRWLRDG